MDKAEMRAAISRKILDMCDDDIVETFLGHGYTMEPLLMQVVRELRELRITMAPGEECR